MHGIVMVEFQTFVHKNFGEDAWRELCSGAHLDSQIFLPVTAYPDEQLLALVERAVDMTSKPATELLGLFGEHLVPPLIQTYVNLERNSWAALDLLENTEKTIHRIVRARQPDATPPKLNCKRVSPVEVAITYRSPREFCALAKGLIRGVASFFQERIEIEETSCMHSGDDHCLIFARKRD